VHWQSSNDLVVLASMSKDVQELIGQVLSGQIKPAEMAARQAAAAAADGSSAT
jgi:enoyl-CoA hydratase